MSGSRSRRPERGSSGGRSDTSSSTSPERGVEMDDDNESFTMQLNDSQSSLAPSLSPDSDQEAMRRAIAERARVSPISRLPAELMIAIFAKLTTPADLKNCMLVSREWSRNSVALLWHRPQTGRWNSVKNVITTIRKPNSYFLYSNLVKRLNLSTLGTEGDEGNEVSDGTLIPMSTCKRIERLTLTNCKKLTDLSLTAMLKDNHSLLALDITNVTSATDRTMYMLADNAVKLQGLNITNCNKITDESLEAVARSCRHLKRLKLNNCEQLTDKSVIAFAVNCRYLLEIDLQGCRNLEDASITTLITEGPNLRELRLAHCSRITDQAFLQLPPDITYESLRILDLTDCNDLQDAGVQKIVTAAPRLRNLVLAKCRNITDRAVMAIARLGKNLHYIHLGHCSRITDIGVQTLVKMCNRIRYIDLACCANLTDASVQQLATLPKLKRIGLVKCTNITDVSIAALAKPKQLGPGGPVAPTVLERVHLSYCTNLTLSGIYTLLVNCPRLTHLSLTGVQAFLREELLSYCRPAPDDFNEHQRELFCVFSGAGVQRLRLHLQQHPPGRPVDASDAPDGTMYDDDGVDIDINIDGEVDGYGGADGDDGEGEGEGDEGDTIVNVTAQAHSLGLGMDGE